MITLLGITGITPNIDPALRDPNTFIGILTSRFMTYAIAIAGLYFFVRIIISGFSLMTSSGDQAKVAASKQALTNSLIGLIIVVSAFFLGQIIQYVFGINIGLN